MSRTFTRLNWLLFMGSCLFYHSLAAATTVVQILPTRVVLEKQRSIELTLINSSDSASKYRIFLKNMRTDEMGSFEDANEAREGEKFADSLIRFSPRSIDIAPKSRQKVRLVVRKPRDLADGEYRTHMVFRSSRPAVSSALEEETENISVSLVPIIQLSIPVIVRHGNLSARVELKNPKIQENKLSIDLVRQGTRSLYGDLSVFRLDQGGELTQVGFSKGIAVYVPNGLRRVQLALDLDTGSNAEGTPYVVRFKEDSTYGGDQEASLRF